MEKKKTKNFIRQIIDDDIKNKRVEQIVTRFPPEPNGFLHFGHAKSICLNFGIAQEYDGRCHLRFDDTNPEKENDVFVQSIKNSVRWLGFEWGNHLYFASDYFEKFYEYAVALIQNNFAYVDSQTFEMIKLNRGTLTMAGNNSPFRDRSIAENIDIFGKMKNGEFKDGTHVLRAKINMQSPNLNLRDPVLYRIRHVDHHRQGSKWCIYPMYDFAHPISDAIERISHSICTLEFEDHRPLYDWIIFKLAECGFFEKKNLPRQFEFSRLNISNLILSKRLLSNIVSRKYVSGWDDPRMPTIPGAIKRGYTKKGFQTFCEMIGVTKSYSQIDFSVLEECMREDLNFSCLRRIAVLSPITLIIENLDDDHYEECFAPNHPKFPELGKRTIKFGKELIIDKNDFQEKPEKGFFRLSPGSRVRLRYAYIFECTGYEKDLKGNVTTVKGMILKDSKSGTSGANTHKVKGNIHWLLKKESRKATINVYDRLLNDTKVEFGHGNNNLNDETNSFENINDNSLTVMNSFVEDSLIKSNEGDTFQFERHGYFILDKKFENKLMVFNKTVSLKDTWQKVSGK